MAVRRSSVALAAVLGALTLLIQLDSLWEALDTGLVAGLDLGEAVIAVLLYGAAALQFHASCAAEAEQEAAATLWITGGLVAGAVAFGLLVLGSLEEFGEPYFWWPTVLQVGFALSAAAVVGFARRGRRGEPPRPPQPKSALFVVSAVALALAIGLAVGEIADRAYDPSGLRRELLLRLAGPLVALVGIYMLTGVLGRLGAYSRLAVTGALAAALTAAFAVAAINVEEVPWRLEVVGPEARLLVVRATDGAECSRQLKAEVLDRTADEIQVRVTRAPGPCQETWDEYGERAPLHLRLDPPLHGERIRGPGMEAITVSRQVRMVPGPRRPSGRRTRTIRVVMPRVTGMAPADARAFLGIGIHRVGVVSWAGDGPTGRAVIAQSPASSGSIGPPLEGRRRWEWSKIPITLTTGD